ncbi:MAG: UDP-glucose/GDP-mannose dehydrogenase family protein [Nanoarchaeota archaeon]|nr:UDP-glucose/GDP-mannose dehydrogenase family protein [Nanoarchaeota archaeon]
MDIAIIGTGYVGLVTGTLFADRGNNVICIDKDPDIIKTLKSGKSTIFEPGLEKLIQKNLEENTLTFSDSIEDIKDKEVIFLGVGTPSKQSGEFNLEYLLDASREVGEVLKGSKGKIIVTKSTVPQGTWKKLGAVFDQYLDEWHYVSNPETLAEGTAVKDFDRPDRVIIGTVSDYAHQKMKELYAPFLKNNNPLLRMHPASAELSKLGANTKLAMAVAFNNEIARICDQVEGADYNEVRLGITSDARIGTKFSYASPGYGGSCFPKDVQGLAHQANLDNASLTVLEMIHESNEYHKLYSAKKILSAVDKKNPRIAIWGLTFKPNTDDMRDSASVPITNYLLEKGVEVVAYDPIDTKAKQVINPEVIFANSQYEAIKDADALVLLTEWSQFDMPDYKKLKQGMRGNMLIDLRNRWDDQKANSEGFNYIGMGRTSLLK